MFFCCDLGLNFALMTESTLVYTKKSCKELNLLLAAAMTFLGMYGVPKLLCQLDLAYPRQATGRRALHTRLA